MTALTYSIALFSFAALASCNQAEPRSERNAVARLSTEKSQGADILRRMGLTIPASATVEYSRYQRGLDDNARLILLMPAADWATMQAQPPLNAVPPDRYTVDEALSLGASEESWSPGDEPEIKGAQISLPDAKFLNVGVAPAGDGRVRIYLFWFET